MKCPPQSMPFSRASPKRTMTSRSSHAFDPIEVPRAGEIYVTVPMDAAVDRGFPVLVTSVEDLHRSARVVLLTPRTRFATDADVLLPRDETGYHVDLLAQTDVSAPVWWAQLEKPIAQIDSGLAEYLGEASVEGLDAVAVERRGLPIRTADDPRSAFKRAQLEAIRLVAGDCVRDLMTGVLERVDLDPELVKLALQGDEFAKAALGGTGTLRPRPIPLDLLEELIAGDLDMHSLGVDGSRIIEQLMRESLSADEDVPIAQAGRWEPERSGEPGASTLADRLLALRRAQGQTCVRLRTTASAWESPDVPGVAVARLDTATVQLNCETEDLVAA